MVINGLRILNVLVGFQDFVMHLLDEVLFQDLVHINDFLFLGNTQVALNILFEHVSLIDLLFSFKYFLFLPLSCFIWQVLTREFCKYVETLWVLGHGRLSKAP